MLISKKNRREVYKYLFKGALWQEGVAAGFVAGAGAPAAVVCARLQSRALRSRSPRPALVPRPTATHPTPPPAAEGVLYAEKDFNLPKHPEIDVPNLEVIKLMQSFKSKEYVTERYAWRHFYWCAAGGLGVGRRGVVCTHKKGALAARHRPPRRSARRRLAGS